MERNTVGALTKMHNVKRRLLRYVTRAADGVQVLEDVERGARFLQNQGDARTQRALPIPAYRGLITDRRGEPLAVSTPVVTLWADPRTLPGDRESLAPLARRLGIEHMLYTRLEVEDGRFTGRVVEPICFEEGKIYWIREFIEEHGVDLAKSFFYTDSVTDMPLLDMVGHPVVVNPDPLLYRRALRRRWPVRFFESPES